MHRRAFVAAALPGGAWARGVARHHPVDVALVLAADVSSSMDDDEVLLQRDGCRAALTGAEVLGRVAAGTHGAIAVAWIDWSGLEFQQVVLPWARIDGPSSAATWADALARAPLPPPGRRRGTSISGGIDSALRLLAALPWPATRRVIDISGDGVNNSGRPVEALRDQALDLGVTINGLVIEGTDPRLGGVAPPGRLADYFRDTVIGGQGAFVLETHGFGDFATAMRRKLVREIAGHPPMAAV
ncbi:DUF1194 domain-containing protein [Humitalea sp. 24SJ18S-53]|uniref:DUF1194 domain-containing protein n=1 Tax=Humitalea sp. 24SJ18S-53 TaxID=3422307 RepID=UPI003D667BEF